MEWKNNINNKLIKLSYTRNVSDKSKSIKLHSLKV